MESIKSRLSAYKPKVDESVVKRTVTRWQDYAAKISKEFNLDQRSKAIIFKHAKQNVGFLESKVAMAYEKCEMEHGKLEQYGHYLIALFRKVRPWEKDKQ